MAIFEKSGTFKEDDGGKEITTKTIPKKEGEDVLVSQRKELRETEIEKRERFEGLIMEVANKADFKIQGNWESFTYDWLNMDYPLSFKRLILEERKIWFLMKKEGKFFQDSIKEKINSSKNSSELFGLIHTYLGLGYEDTEDFFGQILGKPEIWNCVDGSSAHTLLEFLEARGNQNNAEAVIGYINNIVKPGYARQAHLANDLYTATMVLRMILGSIESNIRLQSLAEQDTTFNGWFEKSKLSIFDYPYSGPQKQNLFEVFDEEKESARLLELENQYNQWLKDRPQETLDKDYIHQDLDENFYSKNQPKNPNFDFLLSKSARLWEKDKLVNFYGRFRARTKDSVLLNGNNYLTALRGTAEISGGDEGLDSDLRLLSGAVEDKLLLEKKPENLDLREIYKVVSLGVSELLCRAVLDNKREEALEDLEKLRQLVNQNEEIISESLVEYFSQKLDYLGDYLAEDSNFNFPELPRGAESFFMYHAWFNKARELPDFRVLLAEKVRWLMANDLSNNLKSIEFDTRIGLPISGPDLGRFFEIIEQYKKGLELYKTVEKEDTPIYWEAIDKLEDSDARRIVVFGRDGRFFFTALKASIFGTDNKEVKYVVVTRTMKDNEPRSKITKYLKQNGISLDFTFVDTGFRGTIPELAIEYLADEQGVELSKEKIDEKIMLLASADSSRVELSRRRRSKDVQKDAVMRIEDQRPQNMNSPAELKIDERGKLRPKGDINSVFDQLGYWVVEHASLRNFVPRLNPDKRIEYTRQNPLEGLTFVQDYRGESIGTHPIELWEDKDKKRFLIKGGPEHTLRADFVGQRFLSEAGLRAPTTELLMVNDQLRLKINFLENYKVLGLNLPAELQNSKTIQSAVLIDAFLGQYDRTPWNIMFPNDEFKTRTDDSVAFIDNGASLFSRARGGHKGFPEHFDIEQLTEILANPQFIGQPVNEAYHNLIEIKDGQIEIKDNQRFRDIFRAFIKVSSDRNIDSIIEQAGYPNGRRSVFYLETIIEELEKEVRGLPPESSNHRKTQAAIETYKKVIEAGGESAYLKKTLRQRRNDIIAMFKKLGFQSNALW